MTLLESARQGKITGERKPAAENDGAPINIIPDSSKGGI
jgi:hypothetical protein